MKLSFGQYSDGKSLYGDDFRPICHLWSSATWLGRVICWPLMRG
jgi:hypothetical protein